MTFFVNRRWIQSRMLSFALEEAYHGLLPDKRYPLAAINLEIPYGDLDVNCHPAKREVRFHQEGKVFSTLQRAVRAALVADSPVPAMRIPGRAAPTMSPAPGTASFFSRGGLGGTKTFREFMRLFEGAAGYRYVATATPSPNEFTELLAYAAFLDVMDVGQAKTRFFKRDSTKADHLTLYPHKAREFWLWVSSWALFLALPSDLGPEYSDEGYDLPELDVPAWNPEQAQIQKPLRKGEPYAETT